MKMNARRWCWQIGLVAALAVVGCESDSGRSAESLAELGIDDGASAGLETSAPVTGKEEVVMELATGARVKIPEGAADTEIVLGLKRPADSVALALIKGLASTDKVASAPYVVTPHGTKFKAEVEVTLPVVKDRDLKKLRVVWLEDEKDTKWKELGVPEVTGKEAVVRVDHFSVLLLVEGEREPSGAQPGYDDEDGGAGGEDMLAAGDASDGGSVDASEPGGDGDGLFPVLSSFPIDFTTDCPAHGCSIELHRLEDGVWLDCLDGDEAAFDPETFDFAQACAGAVASNQFVYDGQTKYVGQDYCDIQTKLSDGESRLLWSACNRAYTELRLLGSLRGADGRWYEYEYDDCDGTCTGRLWVSVLAPADTTALNAQCAAVPEQNDYSCALVGAQLPFGPSGVGATPPAALTSMLWILCDGSAADPQGACSDVLAAPNQSGVEVVRFNEDGTLDKIARDDHDVWYAYCRQPAGTTGSQLRVFWCEEGYVATEEGTWEVQRIGSVDYLLWDDGDTGGPDVYVAAPGTFVAPDPDPCAGAEPASCVIR